MTGDEYDPLRERFEAEPFLLTPPPGQLSAVTARARRRRRARMSAVLVSSVASLALVFAGGALVTDRVLADRDPRPVTGRPTEAPTSRPEASPAPTPTEPIVVAPTRPPRVRPDEGTDVLDLTWISTETGWALGFLLDCTGKGTDSSQGRPCHTVLHTTDGGQTWDKIATMPDPVDSSGGATQLRFANRDDGYLILDGALFISSDGGRTWVPSMQSVVAVEAARSGAVALVSASPGDSRCSPCKVVHAPLASHAWTQTLELPDGRPELRRSGDSVLVSGFVNPAGGADIKAADVRRSADGGLTWTRAADPCADVHIMGHYVPFATGFELAGKAVLAACLAFDYDMNERRFILVSADGGVSYGDWHDTECGYSSYALASATTIGCPSQDGVRVSRDGGLTWAMSLAPPRGVAAADGCGFQNAEVGRCVRGRTVYTTRDAGRTWSARDVGAS